MNELEKDPLEGTTEEEREGVKAIQYLQGMAHKFEPLEISLANWRIFSDRDKASTLEIYKFFSTPREVN